MTDYDDTNTFVLFKNDKEGNEKRPDYTGKVNVNGKELRLAAWIKDGKKGKFMAGKVSEFEDKKQRPISERTEPGGGFDEDIPFARYMDDFV